MAGAYTALAETELVLVKYPLSASHYPPHDKAEQPLSEAIDRSSREPTCYVVRDTRRLRNRNAAQSAINPHTIAAIAVA